jgi:hypothetical protein
MTYDELQKTLSMGKCLNRASTTSHQFLGFVSRSRDDRFPGGDEEHDRRVHRHDSAFLAGRAKPKWSWLRNGKPAGWSSVY